MEDIKNMIPPRDSSSCAMCRPNRKKVERLEVEISALVESLAQVAFKPAFKALAADIHATAKSKGFWHEERNDGEIIALIHSELSEALEALRAGNPPDDKIPEFSGVEAELADVIIRIMDYASARDFDVAGAIIAKVEMNKTRPPMHGKKF